METFSVLKISKYYFSDILLFLYLCLVKFVYFSINCARKAKAEEYPKNFALLRLAEKTIAKAKQQ